MLTKEVLVKMFTMPFYQLQGLRSLRFGSMNFKGNEIQLEKL